MQPRERMTIAHKPEPTHEITLTVDRKWIADMLADLEAGNVKECEEILKAALRLFDQEIET